MKWELILVLLIVTMPLAMATDFNQPISSEDKATFDQILEPVMKIYNMVKYAATVIAVIILLFAGVSYMTSGNDPKKRDTAKNMVMYVVTKHFGLENKSFNYLAIYNADYKKIIENFKAVAEASREIISYLEEGLVGG